MTKETPTHWAVGIASCLDANDQALEALVVVSAGSGQIRMSANGARMMASLLTQCADYLDNSAEQEAGHA